MYWKLQSTLENSYLLNYYPFTERWFQDEGNRRQHTWLQCAFYPHYTVLFCCLARVVLLLCPYITATVSSNIFSNCKGLTQNQQLSSSLLMLVQEKYNRGRQQSLYLLSLYWYLNMQRQQKAQQLTKRPSSMVLKLSTSTNVGERL